MTAGMLKLFSTFTQALLLLLLKKILVKVCEVVFDNIPQGVCLCIS